MNCPDGCLVAYPHKHMTAMDRLDWEQKVCGCGSSVCRQREAVDEP